MDLAKMKNFLKVDEDITEDDVEIQDTIDEAIAYIENSTGKKFKDGCKVWERAIKITVAYWYRNRQIYMNKPGTVYELPHSMSALINHISLSNAYERLDGGAND